MNTERHPQQLTVKEALEQGYTYWGYDNQEFQHINSLDDISPAEFEEPKYPICLFDKEAQHPGFDVKSLPERLAEEIICDFEIREDDYSAIEDAIKSAVDWNEVGEKINAALQKIDYYFLTKIKLVP